MISKKQKTMLALLVFLAAAYLFAMISKNTSERITQTEVLSESETESEELSSLQTESETVRSPETEQDTETEPETDPGFTAGLDLDGLVEEGGHGQEGHASEIYEDGNLTILIPEGQSLGGG